jgi:hypothetical protein
MQDVELTPTRREAREEERSDEAAADVGRCVLAGCARLQVRERRGRSATECEGEVGVSWMRGEARQESSRQMQCGTVEGTVQSAEKCGAVGVRVGVRAWMARDNEVVVGR